MDKRTVFRGIALLAALVITAGILPLVPVAAKPVLKEDGWYYADKLPAGITKTEYKIQYRSYYDKVATSSPGSGWKKGALAKNVIKDKGDPYWSNIELTTSDTRVLLDTYYYHYCGSNAQGHANYYATDTFPHYDSVDLKGLKPDEGHADHEDSRYRYYILRDSKGNRVYCRRGKTCQSDLDIHGDRCYYWYRANKYQDKTKTIYYNYSKTDGWKSTADKKADRVEVRYKPRTTTTIKKTTTTQKTTKKTTTTTKTVTTTKVTATKKTTTVTTTAKKTTTKKTTTQMVTTGTLTSSTTMTESTTQTTAAEETTTTQATTTTTKK